MVKEARVLAYGMACPVGLRAAAALAAMYAGINRFTESDVVLDAAGDPARGAMLRRLDPKTSRTERATFFARHAFAEVVRSLVPAGLAAVPCFIAWPEPGFGPTLDLGLVQRGLAEIVRAAGGTFALELQPRRTGAVGRAGVFVALHAALDALSCGACSVALVGGFDSCVDPLTLRALVDANRLLGRRNPDGLLPGEGAAFMVLTNLSATSVSPPLARLSDCALAGEPNQREEGAPNGADGLTRVFSELRSRRPGRVDVVISAQTGEGAYQRAFSYAYLRNATLMPEPLRQVTLGALLGDTGAAAGAMALITAVAGMLPALPGRPPRYGSALVYGESDRGTVGGCIVEPASGRRA